MAGELNMQAKHSLEKAAAHQADCFTTVSDVTARECQQLLEINPHVTPNGFEKDFVPKTAKALAEARAAARAAMLKMASSLVGRALPEDSFLVATSGRCEYRNKGLDVFLDSAAMLRDQMWAKMNLLEKLREQEQQASLFTVLSWHLEEKEFQGSDVGDFVRFIRELAAPSEPIVRSVF